MASLSFGVLGPLEVRVESTVVTLASARQRLLLALLLANADRPVSSDKLVDELWGDELPGDPAAALRTQVSRLRRALGPASDVLVTEPSGYRVRVGAGDVDAGRFEALAAGARDAGGEAALELMDAALALWRGAAYDEFADRSFAQGPAVRLEELRSGLIEERATVLLSLGRAHEAAAATEELLSVNPERERARAVLMRALYAQGRHAEALACFRAGQSLADELGLDVSPELVTLEREILTHDVDASDRPSTPIPMPASTFVGRRRDLETVSELLGAERLVTLCGPGGVGKTRLALEIAQQVGARYADGVRFCDLGGVRRAATVARAIATSVGVTERGHRRIEEQLIEHVSARNMLVIIDNCEHVLDAAAAVARGLIEGTRQIDVLATSRERLAVAGEHVWTVPPLDASGPNAPAVELFLDRARALDPSFAADDAALIASICTRLDGLPLAIELAVARLPGLTPAELADRLDQRLRLLVRDDRGEARHRSLRAVIDWSYDRMSPEEQLVFERLGVFAGRFDVDAAWAVASPGESGMTIEDLHEMLLRFVERSVIVAHHEGRTTRYALLDSLRGYATEKLAEHGELEATRDRHGRWAVELADHARSGMAMADEPAWVRTLDAQFAELRAAHGWLVGRDTDMALRLVSTLHFYALWYSRSEVFRWAEVSSSAAVTGDALLRCATFATAAQGACQRGEFGVAEEYARAAMDAAHDLGVIERRYAVAAIAEVCLLTGELERAAKLFEEAGDASLRAGDVLGAVWAMGSVALSLAYSDHYDDASVVSARTLSIAAASESPSVRAFAEYVAGEISAHDDIASAQARLREAARLAASAGSNLIAGLAEVTMASLMARHGDAAEALEYYESVVLRWRRTMSWMPLSVTLRSLIELLTRLGGFEDAAVLYGAVYSGRIGAMPFGQDETILREVSARITKELGETEFVKRVDEGGALETNEVVERALGAVRRAQEAASLPGSHEVGRRAKRTFMFTDIVGSTALAQAMGDTAWEALMRWHDTTLRALVARFGGQEVKHTGDGFFVCFESARAAVECARETQQVFERHRRSHGFAPELRIALHAAEATRRGADFVGTGVNVAARLCSEASGGQIVASENTVEALGGVSRSGARSVRLRGVRSAVSIVEIDWSTPG